MVSSIEMSLVRLIVSPLDAALIASSKVSKNWLPIRAWILLLAKTPCQEKTKLNKNSQELCSLDYINYSLIAQPKTCTRYLYIKLF